MNEHHELPESRLATTDVNGNRIYLHPEDIQGKWKDRRSFFYWFLIILYLVLPWIYVNGEQWVRLDLPKREFTIFGNIFYGHDGPLLVFLIFGFVILMAFITSLWGRVWCGWACPQTVFIDTIYRKIETLVEGKARQRRALDRAPWTAQKIFKRSLKWFLYIVVSLHIVHSFLGYFVGTHELFWITLNRPSENWTLFVTMLIMTGIILFDFAWFREQFCIIACPYGRFQSVAMDDDSKVVAYDYNRGEPRRNKGLDKSKEGDCINCNHCVKACPTGIDIREGTQLECIACTMCIDACDNIMRKVKKPEGLIRYASENELKGIKSPKFKIRSLVYLVILVLIGVGLNYSLSLRDELKVQILRGSHTQTPYQVIKKKNSSSKEIVNHFKLKLFKTGGYKNEIGLKLNTRDQNQILLTNPYDVLDMKKDFIQIPIFFRFSQDLLVSGKSKTQLEVWDLEENKLIKSIEVKLVGPLK